MRAGLLILFFASFFNQILASFPFDLSKISDDDEKSPNISRMSLEESSKRPIGAFPPEYYPETKVTRAATTTTSPAVAIIPEIRSGPIEVSTPKRRRVNRRAITPDLSIDEIIEIELFECGYTKEEKLHQYRKTLQLIARNDLKAFNDDEAKFKSFFNHKMYSCFKKDDADFYLLRFMVMFGADKLIKEHARFVGTVSDKNHRFLEAFNYLLKTKPFDLIIDFFGQYPFTIENETRAKMIQAIRKQYPNLSFFKDLFVESLHSRSIHLFLDACKTEDERIAFNLILDVYRSGSVSYECNYLELNFYKVALHFPQLYLELDDVSKHIFLIACIRHDDVNTFEGLIALDPNMILYVSKMTPEYIRMRKIEEANRSGLRHTANNLEAIHIADDRTILHEAIWKSAFRCTSFLSEIAPELLVASSPTMTPALECAFVRNNSSFYEIFYNLGYTELSLVKDFDGKEYNFIQYAFYVHSSIALDFFISKVGPDFVKAEIGKIWRTTEEILVFVMNIPNSPFSNDFRLSIFKLFDIDMNATYRYKNREGNVMAFIEAAYLPWGFQIPGLKHCAPVFLIDPITGEKTLKDYGIDSCTVLETVKL